jgi:hypothetical protein
MSLALALLFTLLLSAESLWLFALSAHVARFMETADPIFWSVAICVLWFTYSRGRSLPRKRAVLRSRRRPRFHRNCVCLAWPHPGRQDNLAQDSVVTPYG